MIYRTLPSEFSSQNQDGCTGKITTTEKQEIIYLVRLCNFVD